MFITLKEQNFTAGTTGVVSINIAHIVRVEPVTLIGTRQEGTQLTLTTSDHGAPTRITVTEKFPDVLEEIRKVTAQ